MSTATAAQHGMKLMRRDRHDPTKVVRYFNDFVNVNDEDWAIVQDGTQVPVGVDRLGGWMSIPTRSSSVADNDETYISSLGEAFIFDTTRELMFECRVSHTLAAAAATWVIGLSDTVGADTIVTAGTLATSLDGAVFIKEELAGNVAFVTSNAATQVRTATAYTWTDADIVKLGFYYDPGDGITAKVTPVVNDGAGTTHDLTISGLLEMHLLMGTKTHGSAQETPGLEVDWVEVIQRR